MINSGIGNNDITLSVGFDYSKAIGQDAPRAAAELQKVFSNFGGKNRALIEPLGRISSSTTEFAKSLEAANARVIAFGASVGIIYNIQKAFTELVKSTVQVEKKLTDINVVLSTSSSQLRKFGDELFSIANDTGKSFEEVSNAAIEFSRQGLGVQETLKRTKDALILTRIAGIDTKDAVDALTAGVNSFSKSLIDSTQIVNKFAAVDAAFAVSSQDLAEALRRVGSSAQDAGVDLDELAGLVTSVQQTTARGGAVIGNALKTIFSRLSRGETIRELKDLGVQIDESQTGIQKLKALSAALQNVSGTQGAAIKEAAGGVYQINVVSAALGDLSKQYGIYEQALLKSRGATDEAISRNKELGTTLAALATTTENNLVKAFSKIGSLTIDTPFRSILKGINTTLLEPMGKLGDEGGSEFVTNFFKGIGKFIEGPGLTYITLVGANLTKALVGFAGDAFKQLQRYNKDNAQLLATQKGISLELERDQNLVLGIASGNIKVADAQSLIIQRLQQDLALREKIAAISRGIGQGVIKSGIAYSAETGTPQRIKKTFAGGLVPSPKEVFTESLGAMSGGYKPGKVKVTNVPGLGRAIYNDNETIKNFPGLAQPAIMPPQNSSAGQKYQKNFYGKHGFNPYMAGGMIPNFASLPGMEGYSEYVLVDSKTGTILPNQYKNLKTATLGAEIRNKKFGAFRFTVKNKKSLLFNQYKQQVNNPFNSFYENGNNGPINPYFSKGNIPNFAFKSRAGSFGDVEFENKYGGGIMDIMGKTAEIGVFDTLKKGQGHSRGLYQDLFGDLRNKGIKTVKGFLIPQTDNKPREDTDLSKLKALLPQIIRGRYGKSSVLSVGEKKFKIPGGEDFDGYLNANQKMLWGAVSGGGDVDYVTKLSKGNIPNFAKYPSHKDFLKRNTDESVLKMLEAYPAKFGSYNKKYLNIDLPQGESKVRYSDPIDATEFEKRLYQLGSNRGYIANKGLVPNFATKNLMIGYHASLNKDIKSFRARTEKSKSHPLYENLDPTGFIHFSNKPNVPDIFGGLLHDQTGKIELTKDNTRVYKTLLNLGTAWDSSDKKHRMLAAFLLHGKTGQTLRKFSDSDDGQYFQNTLSGENIELVPQSTWQKIGYKNAATALQSLGFNSVKLAKYNYGVFNPSQAKILANGGNIPNFAKSSPPKSNFKSRAGSFGDIEFENKYGGGIVDIEGKTAEIGVFDTVKKGQGHSRGLYQDLFDDLRKKGIKTVKGFLIPQTDNKPKEDTDLSRIKALLPQIIRGRYGKSNELVVGDKVFKIPGGDKFDPYLNANQKSIWGAVSGGADADYTTKLSKGLVPNFSGLAGAIKRESQSVPASTIKVGMDNRLKSAQNPTGLGVYNTIHEPNGLSQGITRAYSEGLNPKTYNIPNFADFKLESKDKGSSYLDKVLRPQLNELLGSIQKNKISFDKLKPQIDSLIKESQLTAKSASSVRGIFRNAEINRPGTAGTMTSIQEDQRIRNLVRNGITGFSEFARPQDIDDYRERQKNIEDLGRKSFSSKLRAGIAGFSSFGRRQVRPEELSYDQMVFQDKNNSLGNLGNASRSAKIASGIRNFTQFFERLSTAPYEASRLYEQRVQDLGALGMRAGSNKIRNSISGFSRFNSFEQGSREYLASTYNRPATYDDLMGPANFNGASNVEMLQSKITSLRQKADSFNFLGSGRAIKEAVNLQKSGAITKEEVDALKGLRNNRVQTAAGLGSFLVPTVLTPALQGISDNKKYQATVEAGSSVASLGLTGLSVGATMGGNAGPIGAAIGGAFGLLTSLPGLLKAIRDPLPNLLEDLQKLQESFSRSSANLQQYSTLTDKLSEVYSGAIKNVSISDVKKLESERAQTFSNLDPKVKSLIEKAGKDTSKINEIIGAYTSSQQSQLNFGKILDEVKNTKLLRESDTFVGMQAGFGGMAAQTITTPNYKNIGKNQKTLDELSKNLYSGLIGLKNIESGKNVFDMAQENTGLQSLFGSIQSFEGLKAVFESINKENSLEDFTKQFSDFEAVIKSQDPRVFEELKKRIVESLSPEGMKQAIANNEKYKVAEKEKNKIIDDSINKLLQFNSSLLKFSSDLQVINQKGLLDLDFKINSEKLRMNVQNTLESLNAGDYQKASIKFRENAQENIQKQDLGLFNSKIQTNQEYVEKLSEFQSNFLKSGLKDVTEINKGSPSQLREAIDAYQTRIFSFFEKAGLSNIDVKNLDKKKIDELLKNLTDKATNFAGSPSSSGPEATGLKESELNELLKTLPELRINLEKAQRDQQARDEIIRYQFEKAGLLNTEEKRAQFGIIGGANFDALTKLQNSNRFDIGQTRISANFERSQQLQKLRDDFALSNLGGAGRLNKQFDINQRNIISQSNFESSNLLPKLLQREGANNLQFNEVGTKISTKEQLDNEIKIREEKSKGKEISVNERDILTALKRVQEDFISGQEKIVISKENSLELSKETLKIEKELLKYRFQEERIADNLKNIEGRIKEGRGISGGDIKSVIKEQFDYTPRDFQRDAILGVNEVSATIKTSFSGAISSIIKDGKNFGDAFREMLIGVLNKIVDKTSDITTNLLFNGISSAASSFTQGKNAGGLIKGYSTGGKVTGGSGVRDDVPAMLTDGEYVIKKSAVEAIGKANLDKINYGNDSIAFNLKNDYAYNDPKFPTSGKLDVSSGLSNFGLMDTTISRTNESRLEKEQNLISYLEQKRSYDKNVSDAMKAFRKQKRNRLYGAYFSAAVGVAGAGLSSAFGPAAGSGASKGVDFNGFQNTGARMAATGGLIQKFANGGHVFGGNSITDTIPAMLTGGEYVIKKDKVNKFGKNFFDNLNNSSVRKYADGGLVSPAFAPVNTNKGINTDLTLQFSSLTNAINNLSNSIQPNTNKDNYGINNYITVSVSVDSQNGVTTESSVNSQSKGNTRNDNDQNQVEKLKKGLENDMGAFINKQMKQGGTIYTFVNGRIGR